MKIVCIIFSLGICLSQGFNLNAQSYSAKQIADSINSHFENNPIEKVYLDLNKSNYVSGETIWFKVYTTAGYFNQLSPLSKIIYVELIDPKGELVQRIKVYSDNGIGASQIDLPQDLNTGKYLFRAYSNWMQNSSQESFFSKELNIFNLFESTQKLDKASEHKSKLSVSFMPESGNLIAGIQSRVAFKIVGTAGYGHEASGELFDDAGNSITKFETTHLGMGSFSLLPEAGKSYYVILDQEWELKYDLPQPKDEGVSMYLMNVPQLKDVRFKISNSGFQAETIHIVAHCRGLTTYAASAAFNAPDITGLIPKNSFLPGVNFITIFNEDGLPLAERAFYIDSIPEIQLAITPNRSSYGIREQVSLEIDALDASLGIESFLSFAATSNNDILIDQEEHNIISSLYLKSDLSGHIEAPANYFNERYEDAWSRLDLLMMTQGWSRYDWEKIIQSQVDQPLFNIEQGIQLAGELKHDIRDKAISAGTVSYIIQDSTNIYDIVETDRNGEFFINDLFFTGKKAIVLTGKNQNDKPNVRISLDTTKIYAEPVAAKYQISGSLSDFQAKSIKRTLQRQEIDAAFDFENNFETLEEVTVKADKITAQDKVNNLFGEGDYTLDVTELDVSQTALHPLELVRGRVAGVRVIGGALDWKVEIRGPGSINSGTDPLILVDNVEVPIAFLNTIPARQIQQVEVYKGASAVIFGVRGANGVLAFFTKTGDDFSATYSLDNVTTTILEGYQAYKEFYSPDYTVKIEAHAKPDKRAVLHWDPLVKTDQSGKASITFYTADEPMDITLILEGMTQSGKVGFVRTKISVRK